MPRAESHFDVLIVGAGLSGIGMAAHLRDRLPGHSYAILERRDRLGGTWDLFRYPGVRSDSDMHTLGFAFEPWVHEKSIADGPAILDYLDRIVDERGIRRHIRFGSTVAAADFDSDAARWRVTLEGGAQLTANFLYLGSGYYDYDEPFDAEFAGREDFAGRVVHPQFWPDDLDHAGKRVVVIGSGATAVTIVPAMAETAAKVTMLQRTPTWMGSRPAKDAVANWLRKILPGGIAYKLTRAKNILLHRFFFRLARRKPEKIAARLTERTREALGPAYDERHFTPPYNPWEQRLCLVPDDDFFIAVREGRAQVVTDHIDRFEAEGIRLKSGDLLPADIIVTATGLALVFGGKIAISVDGEAIDWAQRWFYRGCMFSGVPNLAATFGYLNASWTLRVDQNAAYVCDLLANMRAKGADIAVPELPSEPLEEDDIFDFSSGYLMRSKHLMPKSAPTLPWRLNQEYLEDRRDFRQRPVDDGNLVFHRSGGAVRDAAE
ncbi:NAD(P)/FAD-dependent oxidoreductase [Erythrobacter sp. LQ02-29]|uniref:flavin-containing monooxygenase n=1 Tax=Erythrobacter sp. LQ02-29 TaxID=2920384 RepID=UPI001F4D7C9D|nr:NAD(P)/FAD-dependent oxidoreductase [Erythrobacter sp. LQ02-29]MCP9222216.1 NAD(P)/FAD-dependent oxidoreductase [Erythrobacter sp. LQ02-29]